MNNPTDTRQEFKRFLTRHWHQKKPMAHVFKTEAKNYLYDTGTNKILICHHLVFELLKLLLTKDLNTAINEYLLTHAGEEFSFAVNAIQQVMTYQKALLLTEVKTFGLSQDFQVYENLLNHSLEMILLEVSAKCNLRCKYCEYNEFFPTRRNHGKESMSQETAFRAIDYLKAHSQQLTEVGISFYGGEPLLEMPLIKASVQYALSIFPDKKIKFALTTNAVVLTPEIADFFRQHEFVVSVSLDGPKEIHDSCRLDIAGEGSYDRVVRGLHFLKEAYGDMFKDKVFINMVYAPPFSEKKLDRIAELWDDAPTWLPGYGRVSLGYPGPGSIHPQLFPDIPETEDKSLHQWSFEKYYQAFTGTGHTNPISNSIMERNLALLYKRPVTDEPTTAYTLNGCCVPGVLKIYVNISGQFQVCEKVDWNVPAIGDVNTGLNRQLILDTFIEGYQRVICPHCVDCWAIGLCTTCYVDVFRDKDLDFNQRKLGCFQSKTKLERFLTYFCTLMEINPEGLAYLNNFNERE